MDPGALAALPVVLAGVLVVSGVLKIGDRTNTAASMVDLRVPFARRLGWFAAWQPWLEIALGAALLVLPGAAWLAAAWLAALFFAALTVLVLRAALRPEDVHCNCFGALSREPVGGMTVLRNLTLTAVAVLVALGAGGTQGFIVAVQGLDRQSVTWLVVVSVGAAAFALLWFRTASPVVPAAEMPATDTRASANVPADVSEEELVTRQGEVLRLREVAGGRAVLFLFVQLECQPCSAVVAELPGWSAALEPAVAVRVVTSATPTGLGLAYPGIAADALYGARGLRTALGIGMLPAAVLVGRDLTVSAGPVLGRDEIEALVHGVVEALALNG